MNLRRLCWFRRSLRSAPDEWSKVHMFPAGSFTALCGRAIPHSLRPPFSEQPAGRSGLIEVTRTNEHRHALCQRCEQFAKKG